MAESNEVQALEKISTEVGESQIKITLSSQCIKAQAFLADKLWKQIERQKEICSFISNNNFKLQTEIKHAELEIKSLIIAHETIKSANIELKKDFLLAKEKKSEIFDRISNGEKKYEALWVECKERYEGIPFVQKLLQAKSNTKIIQDKIAALENKSQLLLKELKEKNDYLANLNRDRVIELADYLIIFLPSAVRAIQDKTSDINRLSNEIDEIVKTKEAVVSKQFNKSPATQNVIENTKMMDDGWLNISSNIERDIITMPRLQIVNSDFDALNAKLDKIKIMKVDFFNGTTTSKRMNSDENISDAYNKKIKDNEFSIFFNNCSAEKEKKCDTFSRKKLINILEDVKLDTNDAYNMVAKINFENVRGVNMIGEKNKINKDNSEASEKENENIEEIDLTKSSTTNNNNILIPPSQFLDISQEKIFSNSQQQVEVIVHMSVTEPSSEKLSQSLKNSQDSIGKKKVSFDLHTPIQEIMNTTKDEEEFVRKKDDNGIGNETMDSQMDISLVSDESYSKIKDMILKKHNLDLSPQFTYAKSKIIQLNTDEKIITSKFFQSERSNLVDVDENNKNQNTEASIEHTSQTISNTEIEPENLNEEEPMDIGSATVSSPKASQSVKADRVVTGLLFNHGTQGIPDSLNVSISTTGFDEGDTDFPHCIDSSLLLSPKADIPMPMNEDNIEVTSQEVPNFLSGLRKTGLSFFGQSESNDPKPGTSGQNQGNHFNFNFGGGEQKTRGGLFSMFR